MEQWNRWQHHARTIGGVLVGIGAAAAGLHVAALRAAAAVSPAPGGILVLLLGLVLAALAGATLWWSLLALGGARRTWLEVGLAWWGGTPAKYVPGKVGSVVARAALLDDARAIDGATATAEVLLTMAAGALLTVSLPVAHTTAGTTGAGVAVAILGIGLVALARRWLGPAPPPLAVLPFVAAVSALALAWLGQGLALAGAIAAVGAAVTVADIVVCSGIAGAAAIAGLLSPTPAGLGPRDALLGLLLTTLIDDDVSRAGAAVILWRGASIAMELSGAGIALVAIRRRAASLRSR